MKILSFIAWDSGITSALFLLLGIFQICVGFILYLAGGDRIGGGRLFVDTELINFFIAAASFFSVTILSFQFEIKDKLKTKQ